METSVSPLSESVSPSRAPLRANSDLTIDEIEDSIKNLKLRPKGTYGAAAVPPSSRADGARKAGDPNLDKSRPRDREIHHLDASATANSQLPNSSTERQEAKERQAADGQSRAEAQPQGIVQLEDKAHTLASRRHASSHDFGVLEVGERPSRAASPMLQSSAESSRRASSQGNICSSVEVESSPTEIPNLNDSFTQQIMAGALKLKTSLFKPERISFADVARNPVLAKRARAEMDNHQFKGIIEGLDGEAIEGRPHDLEVTRLQIALDVVEADAEEESKINSQLAQLVCMRLESSRRAVERLLGILQAITAAEAAYTRAMNAVSKVKLAGECDGQTLRSALSRFSDIPWLIAEAHVSVQNGLVGITHTCQELLQDMRKECQTISHDSAKVHSAVMASRKMLHSSFLAHRSACRIADDAALERNRSGRSSFSTRLELDPWLTESRVVAAHRALHAAQTSQRSLLATAYERVRQTELHRCKVFQDIASACLTSYRNELGPDPAEELAIRHIVDQADCEQDLAQFSSSAAAAVETGKELAERQAAALETAAQDLLCSPDIIRQGEMARWVSGSGNWTDCHFILTRTGFMHWLADAQQDITPLGTFNLAKCQFEAGDAPQFNLTEHHGGLFGKSRRICLKSPTVEDSCDWAIALRELIAAHKVR